MGIEISWLARKRQREQWTLEEKSRGKNFLDRGCPIQETALN
jgi:hypothetical protein